MAKEIIEKVVEENSVLEVENVEDEPEKVPFTEKAKAVFTKVKNSKAAKIAGAAGLVLAGAAGALLVAGRSGGDDDLEMIDLGNDEFVVTESESNE